MTFQKFDNNPRYVMWTGMSVFGSMCNLNTRQIIVLHDIDSQIQSFQLYQQAVLLRGDK